MQQSDRSLPLVRSKRRVADHGEVFTPDWMVQDMLDLVATETARIDSRVLEPACGSGNFLVEALRRKLVSVESRHGSSDFERRHFALLALMSLYGIELLSDNTIECRENLLTHFMGYLQADDSGSWRNAATAVLRVNVVQGDALTLRATDGEPLMFAEWAYLGKGLYQRRDFHFDNLTQRASYQGSLWDHFDEQEIFAPVREYPSMSVEELPA
jgi:hypothetical protein